MNKIKFIWACLWLGPSITFALIAGGFVFIGFGWKQFNNYLHEGTIDFPKWEKSK